MKILPWVLVTLLAVVALVLLGKVYLMRKSAPDFNPLLVERLFDRFFTVETARHSTGLGLSIAQQLTQRLGGSIHARYQEGQLILTLSFSS